MNSSMKISSSGIMHEYTIAEDVPGIRKMITKDGMPFLLVEPSDGGYCSLLIYCGNDEYRKQGELMVNFEELNIEQIAF